MRRLWLLFGTCALALLCAELAEARPGGGHSFSTHSSGGSSHHSSGGGSSHGHGHGGGDGGGELIWLLVRLMFMYPRVGVPVAIVAAVGFVIWVRRDQLSDWDTPHHAHVSPDPERGQNQQRSSSLAALTNRLRMLDPDFSRVLFEDFAYRLFASVQRARPSAQALAALAPYLSDGVRAELLRADLRAIENVVVAALRIERVDLPASQDGQLHIVLLYECNLTLIGEQTQTLYARERWTLVRAAEARSKPPGGYERLGCPNCAAPFRSSDNRRCEYCGEVVGDGRFNFQLAERRVLEEQARPPALGMYAEEQGTNRPTVVAPDHEERLKALLARDPQLQVPAFLGRVRLIYGELNAAYGSNDLSRVRALLSDGMFDFLNYWIEAYRAQNLRNVLEQMQVARVDLAKVVEDRYFDAITVRIFASGIDYTVQADSGKWVGGDRKQARRYTEYWTFIRGAETRGAARTEASCPNCAAPLKASMAGTCAYCSVHLTSGEFDWVLSKIEQDDVYEG